jgi:hypothetical protein
MVFLPLLKLPQSIQHLTFECHEVGLIINYIIKKWEQCHIVIGIFEVHETSKAT